MKFSKFLTSLKAAQSSAANQCIFTAIVPAFNAVHTAKTPTDLRDWLQCYSKDVTVILITPALVTTEARAMKHYFDDAWKEIQTIEENLVS